jgi:hypothetical protein
MKFGYKHILFSMALVFFLAFGVMTLPGQAATIQVIPSSVLLNSGGTEELTLDIKIGDIADLSGISFNMVYDPAVIKAVSDGQTPSSGSGAVTKGALHSYSPFFRETVNTFDNDQGQLHYAELIWSPAEGATISDPVLAASVHFKPVGQGPVKLKFSTSNGSLKGLGLNESSPTVLIQLADSNNDPITYSSPQDITITCNNSGSDHCFIATACYGSLYNPHVALLRQFRDHFLLTNKPGQSFVAAYYRYSPPLAAFIADNETLKAVVRVFLTPLIGIAYLFLHPSALLLLMPVLAAVLFRRKLSLR